MDFAAAVTLTAGAAAGVWQAGFVQNVTTVQRSATYADGATINYRLDHGPAMRDGEPAELPFSYDGGEDLVPGARADLTAADDPKVELPLAVGGAALVSTAGVEELVTWLSLARAGAARKTVLLGRVVWRVNWAATRGVAGWAYTTPAEVPHVVAPGVQQLQRELTAATLPPAADYRTEPDYREDGSTNDYLVGRLARPGQPAVEWAFDDEDGTRPVRQQAPGATTWFT